MANALILIAWLLASIPIAYVFDRIENLALMQAGEHSRHHNDRKEYRRGYKLELSESERAARSQRMSEMRRNGRM